MALALDPVVRGTLDSRLPARGALESLVQGLLSGALADPSSGEAIREGVPPGTSISLSGAARVIAELAELRPGEAPPLSGTAPVWSAPGRPDVARIVEALAQAVTRSGLFYESHLGQVASGVRALEELQAEPLARLPADRADDPAAAPVVHREAKELLQQQLQLLDSGVFRWQGEAWPGVRMEWAIREEPSSAGESAPSDEPAQRAWATTLRVALPALGDVEVGLSLCGDALQARMLARGGSGTEDMRRQQGELAQRLSAAGLRLVACDIREQAGEEGA